MANSRYFEKGVEIFTCNLASPPSRITSDVKLLCSINSKLDISKVPEQHCDDGTLFRKVIFKIEMQVSSSAQLEFAVRFQGEKLGSRNVEVEFQDSRMPDWTEFRGVKEPPNGLVELPVRPR
jgi:hypothetical protein